MLVVFAFLCLWLAGPASAQTPATTLTLASEYGLPGVFETHSAHRLRAGALLAGVSNRYSNGLAMIRDGAAYQLPGGEPLPVGEIQVYSGRVFISAGMGFGLDGSVFLPVYYEYLTGLESPPDNIGPGDASAHLKYSLPFDIPFVSIAFFASGSIPTSPEFGPRLPKQLALHPYSNRLPDAVSHSLGSESPRAGMGAGITFDLSDAMAGPRVELHANAAFDRTMAPAVKNPLGVMTVSLAAEAYLWDGLRVEGELRHQRLAADPATLGTPLGRTSTMGIGLAGTAGGGLTLRAGAVIAPSDWNPYLPLTVRSESGVERTLEYRLQPTVSWAFQVTWQGFPLGRDVDHDGITDGRDICPTLREDKDGFQDDDGCPDPDNDQDGVLDGTDACPYVHEDHDGFEDRDGCPEMDNDHDGFQDTADRCQNDPEDRDGYLDEDGCPDLDDDKDAIPDALDKCPRVAENRNGLEDEDGCPESDTDNDGIPDSRDKCPREDEIVNFFQDEDGCPDEKPEPIRDAVLTGVNFVNGGAELDPGSFLILDGLAARMFAYPGTSIEIQGHVDDRAGARARALTQERAEAVAEYLANRGIEARRMKAVGYGATKPLAPNRTAQGRASNRRIQIHRLN